MFIRRFQGCTKQFEAAGGLACIEPLEYHKDESIKSVTNDLLEQYFYKEEDTAMADKEDTAMAAKEDTAMAAEVDA